MTGVSLHFESAGHHSKINKKDPSSRWTWA